MMLAGIVGNVGSARLRLNGGEFYEVKGELRLSEWIDKGYHLTEKKRHYLFYFRDETFECDADAWSKNDIA